MKRNTAELKEKLIATGVEEIRTRGVPHQRGFRRWRDPPPDRPAYSR